MSEEPLSDQAANGQGGDPAPLTVVGVGASAGGVEALQHFFAGMPSKTGAAFVVVTHLDPERRSFLVSLLQAHTAMPVEQVEDMPKIKPNHVYVIPPGRNLSAIDTHLRLEPLEEDRSERMPINHFFRTLAAAQGDRAIAVLLTGAGTDGTVGLKLVKEKGGLTVVQDPAEAEHSSMPQSAVATGLVDLVLSVGDMPNALLQYLGSRPKLQLGSDGERLSDPDGELLQKVYAQLRGHTGHDFSAYRNGTILRRIRRRMQVHAIETLAGYLDRLRNDKREVDVLYRDLLITVTNFFRDKEAFAVLEEEVIPRLFAGKGPSDTIRVWSTGCATGEEAYSVAILLLEHAGRLEQAPSVQVFATDVSPETLEQARDGLYSEAIISDIAEERLKRFFREEKGGGYWVRPEVRERVIFSTHNLLSDPPFSRLDLIICRNVLIYLKRPVQQRIFELFHYALLPGGHLFLGGSESVESSELFREIDKKHRIFRRESLSTAQPHVPRLPLNQPTRLGGVPAAPAQREGNAYGMLHHKMVERYAPPSVLINHDATIVHLSEHAGRYLQQPGGEPTNNLFRCIREDLRIELRAAFYSALSRKGAVRTRPVPLLLDGEARRVSLHVRPAQEQDVSGFVLVMFDENEVEDAPDKTPRGSAEATIKQLEEELEHTRKRLQALVEEYETSQEEMRAANEELQSMNEELRSTAEELETSKEELQSINEELITVNLENRSRVEELSQLTSDLQNLLSATAIATLFLDRSLRIKRFTPQLHELFNILPSDRGRPLAHLTHNLAYEGLIADAQEVLRSLVPIEREVRSEESWFLMRLLPYRTIDDRIDGVVITLVDITTVKRAEDALRQGQAQDASGELT